MVRLTGQRPRATRGWVLLACATALPLGAVAGTPAHAGRPGYDRSFGDRGTAYLAPPPIPDVRKVYVEDKATARSGAIYVLDDLTACKQKSCQVPRQVLVKYGREGRRVTSFGQARGCVAIEGRGFEDLAVDHRGRPILLRGIVEPEVARLTPAGRWDRSFGGDGKVLVPRLTENLGRIQPLSRGGILATTENVEPEHGYQQVHMAELRDDGRPLAAFGMHGVVNLDLAGDFHEAPVVAGNGSIYVIGEAGATLSRISARGHLDTRFDRTARGTLRRYVRVLHSGHEWGETTTLVPRRGGGVDVFGFFDEHGAEAQVDARGHGVAGFGRGGVRALAQQVWEATDVGGDELFAAGEPLLGIARVFLLRDDGDLDRRFNGGEPILLSDDAQWADPTLVGPGLVDVTYYRTIPCRECRKPFVGRWVLPAGSGR